MAADVFCPKCKGRIGKVNPDSNGYKTKSMVCPNCHAGVVVTYGNGRIEIKKV